MSIPFVYILEALVIIFLTFKLFFVSPKPQDLGLTPTLTRPQTEIEFSNQMLHQSPLPLAPNPSPNSSPEARELVESSKATLPGPGKGEGTLSPLAIEIPPLFSPLIAPQNAVATPSQPVRNIFIPIRRGRPPGEESPLSLGPIFGDWELATQSRELRTFRTFLNSSLTTF